MHTYKEEVVMHVHASNDNLAEHVQEILKELDLLWWR